MSIPAVAGLHPALFHSFEVLARGTSLELILDGSRVLAAPIPVKSGTNNRAAGLLFAAGNLVVSRAP